MKNNPIIPYILIMAFGIGLIFFMSMDGIGNQKEIADAENGTSEEGGATADGGGAELVSSCIGCHGGDLTGGMGPNLVGQDPEYIVDVLVNGIEGTVMTPGMKSEAEAEAIAEYIATLE